MAYINGNKIPAILRKGDKGDKGDNAFIRYSAYADGTDFTKEWSEGQNYIGFATGQTAPTDKDAYDWVLLPQGEKGDSGDITNVETNVKALQTEVQNITASTEWDNLTNNRFAYKSQVDDKFHEVETAIDEYKTKTDGKITQIEETLSSSEIERLLSGQMAVKSEVDDKFHEVETAIDEYKTKADGKITQIEETLSSSEIERLLSGQMAVKSEVDDKFHEVETKITYVVPEEYGPVVGDATEAIQAAINSGKTVYLSNKVYLTSAPLVFPPKAIVLGEGTLKYSGTDAAILLSSTDGVHLELDTIMAENGTALEVDATEGNVDRCRISINTIRAGKHGLYLHSSGKNACYNEFHCETLGADDVGVLVTVVQGYINENRYFINRIKDCNVGIALQSNSNLEISGGYGTNDNKFFNVGFEGIKNTVSDDSTASVFTTQTCAVFLDNTWGNTFRNCRMQEKFGKKMIVFNGSCNCNNIEFSDITLSKVDISTLKSEDSSNILTATRRIYTSDYGRVAQTAVVSGLYGISYNLSEAKCWKTVTSELFSDTMIKPIDNVIINSFTFQSETVNGSSLTLHPVYSTVGSLTLGCPIVFFFGSSSVGLVKITDAYNQVIIDNSSGDYAYKTVSVKWIGWDRERHRNLWDVQVISSSNSNILKVGKTLLTEAQLNSLLALLTQ